jgi:hypothetical protein
LVRDQPDHIGPVGLARLSISLSPKQRTRAQNLLGAHKKITTIHAERHPWVPRSCMLGATPHAEPGLSRSLEYIMPTVANYNRTGDNCQ